MTGRAGLHWATRTAISLLTMLLLLSTVAEAVWLGDVQITLHSHQYYHQWGSTRLVYRVKSSQWPSDGDSWILGVEACVDDSILWYATTPFAWVEEPIRGMRFERSKKAEMVYLWLLGPWEIGTVPVAVSAGESWFRGGAHGEPQHEATILGEIDGPACAGASISLETVAGETVSFPNLIDAGTYEAFEETVLRVVSTSAGWGLSHSIDVVAPEGASEGTVGSAFRVSYDPFETTSGTTDIVAGYSLVVSEEDFAGLPEGAYVIQITYTAAAD